MKGLLRFLRQNLTPADLLLLATLLLASFFSFALMSSPFLPAKEALVTIDGRTEYRLRFDQETTVDLDAPLGRVVIQVRNGQIRIIESSCPDKFCLYERPVTPFGGVIVCAPSRLVIQVQRRVIGDLDCVTQ